MYPGSAARTAARAGHRREWIRYTEEMIASPEDLRASQTAIRAVSRRRDLSMPAPPHQPSRRAGRGQGQGSTRTILEQATAAGRGRSGSTPRRAARPGRSQPPCRGEASPPGLIRRRGHANNRACIGSRPVDTAPAGCLRPGQGPCSALSHCAWRCSPRAQRRPRRRRALTLTRGTIRTNADKRHRRQEKAQQTLDDRRDTLDFAIGGRADAHRGAGPASARGIPRAASRPHRALKGRPALPGEGSAPPAAHRRVVPFRDAVSPRMRSYIPAATTSGPARSTRAPARAAP